MNKIETENEVPPFGDDLGLKCKIVGEVNESIFLNTFNWIQEQVHQNSIDKGWWSNRDADDLDEMAEMFDESGHHESSSILERISEKIRERNDGEMLALMHSELSEALEGLRHGNGPSDHIPEFNCAEEELADVVIRAMDMCQKRGWRLAEAIIAKAQFNSTRPHKHGGKKF